MEKWVDLLVALLWFAVPIGGGALITFLLGLLDKGVECIPRFNGKKSDITLGTGNGIGLTLMGEFRSDFMSGSVVKYQFFCIFYVPIIPVGCYRVKQKGFFQKNWKKSTTTWIVYGTEKWRLIEILIIYTLGLAGVGGVICFINLVQTISNFFK